LTRAGFSTALGTAYETTAENFLASSKSDALRGKVKLIMTSPPFPLRKKKAYGNLEGQAYLEWLSEIAVSVSEMLRPDGSFVIEIGNAWEPGIPAMSTLPLKALLAIADATGFHVCQQFICHNPSRLPGPAQWVTINRMRATDSFTHVWWFAKDPWVPADNRKILVDYSKGMKRLLERGRYNSGHRPSDHRINETSFLKDNGGAIPPNVLAFANTSDDANYVAWCRLMGMRPHPARMPSTLAQFFVDFLTEKGDVVMDCFGGSLTTAAVAEHSGRKWLALEPTEDYLVGGMGRFARSPGLVAKNAPYSDNVKALKDWARSHG
jgi:site-specific DNA-methyltransferase (cytosine-N4-specific)